MEEGRTGSDYRHRPHQHYYTPYGSLGYGDEPDEQYKGSGKSKKGGYRSSAASSSGGKKGGCKYGSVNLQPADRRYQDDRRWGGRDRW